jgi:hypothetical protein
MGRQHNLFAPEDFAEFTDLRGTPESSVCASSNNVVNETESTY